MRHDVDELRSALQAKDTEIATVQESAHAERTALLTDLASLRERRDADEAKVLAELRATRERCVERCQHVHLRGVLVVCVFLSCVFP